MLLTPDKSGAYYACFNSMAALDFMTMLMGAAVLVVLLLVYLRSR
jgi:hypothetical protein